MLIFLGMKSFFEDGWIFIVFIATGLLVVYTIELYYRRFYNEWEKWAKERKSETNSNSVNLKKELSDFKAQEDQASEIITKSLMQRFGYVILFIIGFGLSAGADVAFTLVVAGDLSPELHSCNILIFC